MATITRMRLSDLASDYVKAGGCGDGYLELLAAAKDILLGLEQVEGLDVEPGDAEILAESILEALEAAGPVGRA